MCQKNAGSDPASRDNPMQRICHDCLGAKNTPKGGSAKPQAGKRKASDTDAAGWGGVMEERKIWNEKKKWEEKQGKSAPRRTRLKSLMRRSSALIAQYSSALNKTTVNGAACWYRAVEISLDSSAFNRPPLRTALGYGILYGGVCVCLRFFNFVGLLLSRSRLSFSSGWVWRHT